MELEPCARSAGCGPGGSCPVIREVPLGGVRDASNGSLGSSARAALEGCRRLGAVRLSPGEAAMPRLLRRTATSFAVLVFSGIVTFSPTIPASAVPRNQDSHASLPQVIIDTDLSLWWDDATAIGIANVLEQQGALRILGILSDIRNPQAVPAIDAIDTAYGHPDIPLGAVAHSGDNTAPHGYSDLLVRELPHSIHSIHEVPGAVPLLRTLLARQPDHSVTIVAIGAYTNLAGLLRSEPGQGSSLDGRALVAKKVKHLVIEDGLFPGELLR